MKYNLICKPVRRQYLCNHLYHQVFVVVVSDVKVSYESYNGAIEYPSSCLF